MLLGQARFAAIFGALLSITLLSVNSAKATLAYTETFLFANCAGSQIVGATNLSCVAPTINPGDFGTASAKAEAEFGALKAAATATGSNTTGTVSVPAGSAGGKAQMVDYITVTNGPDTGIIQFAMPISGTNTASVTGFSNPPTIGPGVNVSMWLGTHAEFVEWLDSSTQAINRFFSGTTLQGNNIIAEFAYTKGVQMQLDLSLEASASCVASYSAGGSEYCSASADYFSTLTLGPALVMDASRVIDTNAVVVSDSGFDYLSGFSEVPVPAPLAYMATIVVGFLAARRRV